MLKKTITFLDFNDNTVVEDFYFHLSKAELIQLEVESPGGLEKMLKDIIDAEDGAKIIALFQKILLMTVGKKSADGKNFVKSQEVVDYFKYSDAYSELFMELSTQAGSAAQFIEGVLPAKLVAEAQAAVAQFPKDVQAAKAVENVELPPTSTPEPEPKVLTKDELFEQKFVDPTWIPGPADILGLSHKNVVRAFERKQG